MGRNVRSVLAIVCALIALPALAAAQEGATISGRVTSEAGAPLNSANVFLEGMNIGTLAKEDGRYTFVVPAARVKGQQVTVTARLIGYRAKSATITLAAGAITQDFVLATNPLRLGEVVVTGAGTQTTVGKLGVVVNQVDSTAISNSNEYNIVNALAAKAPNVKITNQAGDPGSSSYIQIRGLRSLSGTGQPLFVVDGTPIDNSTISTTAMTGGTVAPNRAADIDPNDIESVDILKGSAAAAIYGAAASDGAILITTKAGKSGATRFSFNTQLQLNDVSHSVPLQTDWSQGNGGVTDACSVNLTPACTAISITYGAQLATGTPTYDHYAELFREGDQWNNNLTLSGGNDKTTYFLSMGYSNTQGVITGPNNWYDQYNLRVKASQRLADRVVVSGNIAYVDTHGSFIQRGSNVSGLLLGGLRTPPAFNNQPYLDTLTGLQRSFRHPALWLNSLTKSRGYDNPFFVLNADPATSQLNRAFGNVAIDWEVNDWLSLKDNLGGDYYNDQRTEALAQSSSGFPTGSVTVGNNSIYSIDNYLTATGTHTFSPNFSGSLTLGTDAQSQSVTQNFTTGQTLVAPTPFALTNTVVYVPSTFNSLIHSLSYYAHATADLYNQLYVTLGIRRDGFSTFGESEPYAWYPQANVAWTFTNALGNTEQKGVLSFGKLRVGYGETGKPPAPYATQTVLASGASSFFGSGYGDLLTGTQNGKGGLLSGANLGNNNILPEREKELEAGVDFGFFNQTVDAGITWYKENSTDVIQALPIPPSTGFFGALSNAAAIENKGFEVTANWRPLTTAKTSLEFGVTWGQNFTTATNLGGAQFYYIAGGTFTGAVAAMYLNNGLVMQGQDFIRCGRGLADTDTTGGANSIATACTGAPKNALYLDSNGFPIVDPNQQIIANPNPNWIGGFHGSMRFDKLTVTFLVDHKQGGQVWNGTLGALEYFGTAKITDKRNTTQTFGTAGWFPGPTVGPGAGMPVTIDQDWFEGDGSGFSGPSAQNVEDGTYTKLREIGLQYTFSGRWVTHNLGLSSVDLRVAGRNLYTWTNYTGVDPETNLAGAGATFQGVDYFNSPQTRSFVLSIGLNR
jgi:TonB-linked SusC/RagA family outer membrane protein